MSSRAPLRRVAILAVTASLLLAAPVAAADPLPDHEFTTPVFGLDAAPDGGLLVADAGAGIVSLRNGTASLVAELPGIADVASIGGGSMLAITGAGDAKLYRVSKGRTALVADLGAFEASVNPDGAQIDSNPFDVAALTGGSALVADAAANALVIADARGGLDWVATFPADLAGTAHAKDLIGCDGEPIPDLAFACGLPDMIPSEAVPTSVAIGPDGAYYVGELRGIPADPGSSRVWRVEAGTRHAECGTDPRCSVVADGFTSIIDLSFAPDGTLHITELDENSFLGLELGQSLGGTVNACDFGSWSCSVVAGGLPIPTATATTKDGTTYAVIFGLVPGMAEVIEL
jgi:hypothetical protein